jgi:hypothetical protein
MMKTYLMNYQCPHCKMGLQSQHTESGKALSCPGCQQSFVAPQAPPRPLGGWLAFLAITLALGGSMSVVFAIIGLDEGDLKLVAWHLFAGLIPSATGLYAVVRSRRWFVPFFVSFLWIQYVAEMFFMIESQGPRSGMVGAGIYATIWTIYLFKSKRVKETLIN